MIFVTTSFMSIATEFIPMPPQQPQDNTSMLSPLKDIHHGDVTGQSIACSKAYPHYQHKNGESNALQALCAGNSTGDRRIPLTEDQ